MIGLIALAAIQAAAPETKILPAKPILPIEKCGDGEADQEIVVCGKRQSDRYRVGDPDAPFDPSGNRESVSREQSRWIEEGDTGIMSCSAVGPGGWTGCGHKAFKRKRQQKGWYL